MAAEEILVVQEREAAEDFAAAHGKVAAPLAVAVPIALAAGLVDHVPLPNRFDFAGDRCRIHLPQLRPDGSLDVDLVRISHVSCHFVAIGVAQRQRILRAGPRLDIQDIHQHRRLHLAVAVGAAFDQHFDALADVLPVSRGVLFRRGGKSWRPGPEQKPTGDRNVWD